MTDPLDVYEPHSKYATREDVELLGKKIDTIGEQLNYVVDTVTKFITAMGNSPMAKMFGNRMTKETVTDGN